jgi:hypothetical protein
MKDDPPPKGATPFERFDNLLRTVIAVPKSVVEKAEAKERAKNRKKREARKEKTT